MYYKSREFFDPTLIGGFRLKFFDQNLTHTHFLYTNSSQGLQKHPWFKKIFEHFSKFFSEIFRKNFRKRLARFLKGLKTSDLDETSSVCLSDARESIFFSKLQKNAFGGAREQL